MIDPVPRLGARHGGRQFPRTVGSASPCLSRPTSRPQQPEVLSHGLGLGCAAAPQAAAKRDVWLSYGYRHWPSETASLFQRRSGKVTLQSLSGSLEPQNLV